MTTVTLRSVAKNYGSVVGVADLDFTCRDGEFLAILGPSGCGKSTTMRSIAGLEQITAGDILFGGRRVNDEPPARRNVAMAFENFGLYPHMTVSENIAYPLRLKGMAVDGVARAVVSIAGVLKIRDVLGRYPSELSGGYRQRVSLARAMVRKPDVFLLDEPISHLDAGLRSEMRVELKRLQEETGSTMIYVTHDQREALTMADRVVVMDRGRLQQIDTPERIHRNPANRFVATFVGDPPMNLLQARLSRTGDALSVTVGDDTVQLPDPAASLGDLVTADGTEVEIGIRAEDLVVGDTGALSGRVRVREAIGDTVLLTVDTDGGRVRVRSSIGVQAGEGQTVRLSPDPGQLHLFDPTSGRRIERAKAQ